MKNRWLAGPWWRRSLAVVAGALLLATGLLAVYVLAANLLLRTRLLRALINDGPDKIWIDYSSAYSLSPGRVRVRDLRIRDRGVATEWVITLDEGRGSIRLTDLLRRRFHTTRIRGRGLAVRVRNRWTPEEATPRLLSFLPPITGFDAPPLREPGEKRPLPTGREWTVRLDDVAVDAVKEIWVNEYHYTGDATLTGGMLLHARIRFEVSPTTLAVGSGTLRFDEEPIAASLKARLDGLIHPYDLRQSKGADVLKSMTGTGRVAGRIEGVQVLNDLLGIRPTLRLEGGTGSLTAELSLDRGSGHGVLDFSAHGARAVMTDAAMTGGAEGQLRLARLDLHGGLLDFAGSHLEVRKVMVKRGKETPWPWWGVLELPAGDLRTGPQRVFYAHPALRAQNAQPLYHLLNAKLPHWAEWMLKMEGVTATADVALGPSFADVKSLEARGGAFHILGRFHRAKELNDGAFLIDAGPLVVGVGLHGGKSEVALATPRTWFRDQMADDLSDPGGRKSPDRVAAKRTLT
ncbi:MAG TPA: hypothetical protein VGS03_18035, partial [Candidatus Polarisedimenticolia bacterium]|nr:hypothetical protein [Candidatus Polarisedimenticolia bacterium]